MIEEFFLFLASKAQNLLRNDNNNVPGYVHSVDSPLYSIGSTVSEGVRQFVETGVTDKLELETTSKTFLDAVLAPPIPTGVGQTNTTIFVDTNHTKVRIKLTSQSF